MLRPVLLMTLLSAVLADGAHAQAQVRADVDTVRSGIGEESLAPPVIKPQPKPAVSASVPVAVSGSGVTDPMLVKGVVATLSGTLGFDRESALQLAARQALPGLLVSLGHAPDKAAKTVKGIGDVMKFVKSYKVVKETLIPTYTLTTDLTFNGPMVIKNFGGKVPVVEPVAVEDVVVKTSGTDVGGLELEVPVAGGAANAPVKQWVVKIHDRDPAVVDKVRVNLNKQAGTRANYRLLTSEGAELLVDTTLDAHGIEGVAGANVDVLEVQVDLPMTVVPAGSYAHPWQGQSEPGVPSSPNVPSAPAMPDGTY